MSTADHSPGFTGRTLDYPARTSVLDAPCVYRLTEFALHLRPETTKPSAQRPPALPETIPLRLIEAVRLRYFPTRVQENRFECLVRLRSGRQLRITNEEYRGALEFTDRSAEYRAFVRALCPAVAAANPQARFSTGRPWLPLLLEWGFLGAAFAALAGVLWLVGGTGGRLVDLLLIVLSLPLLVRYARRCWPRTFNPHAVPDLVLPAGR